MPDPTVPVPISDLLAAIERIPVLDCEALVAGGLTIEVIKCGKSWPVDAAALLLIVRGVRDLAARVETLTALLEKHGGHAPGCFREKLFGAEGCICGWDQVRAELTDDALARIAVQSTTETPS